MKISSIVAQSKNKVIGNQNEIPWYLPADLQYFKQKTIGKTVIMGRNCYESIGRPLPKRNNIVITKDPYYVSTGVIIAHSISEALSIASDNEKEEIIIIGGGKIYEQTMDICQTLYVTQVDAEIQGDVYYPDIHQSEWKILTSEFHEKDEKNEYNYTFETYIRI